MSVDEMTAAAMKITGVVSSGRDAADVLHEDECAVDDQSGGELKPELVEVARRSEIDYFRSMGVYEKVPIKKFWDDTGAGPISVRWVDINKGDTLCPNYSSRLSRESSIHQTTRNGMQPLLPARRYASFSANSPPTGSPSSCTPTSCERTSTPPPAGLST